MAMSEEEKAIASGKDSTATKKPRARKVDKSQNDDVVMLTGEELRAQTSQNIGALASASVAPMLSATNRTATQMLALGTIQSMPQTVADATTLVSDFFDSYDSESLVFDLTMNLCPPQTQLMMTGA